MTKPQFFTRAFAVLTAVGALVVTAPTGMPGATSSAQAVVGDCTPGSDWGTPRADFAARVVDLVNQHRASKGLSQLSVSTTLTNASVWKARHMARYLYMTHNDPAPPVARTTGERLAACGYPSGYGWGENIAYGYTTPEAVMQAWLNSSGHRANIENSSFRSLGVGAASSSTGRIYWAQAFGTQAGSTPPPPPPPPTYACSNGVDDDGDGKVDYPADPGCTSSSDTDEYNAPAPPPPSYACSNGTDDDGDGKVDYPADPGCTSSSDTDEYNAPAPPPPPPPTYACSNGVDDDGDGKVDYPADPGCVSSTDTNEYNATSPRG